MFSLYSNDLWTDWLVGSHPKKQELQFTIFTMWCLAYKFYCNICQCTWLKCRSQCPYMGKTAAEPANEWYELHPGWEMYVRLRKDQIDKASRILQGGLLLSSQWPLWSSNQMTRPTMLATTGAKSFQELRKNLKLIKVNAYVHEKKTRGR